MRTLKDKLFMVLFVLPLLFCSGGIAAQVVVVAPPEAANLVQSHVNVNRSKEGKLIGYCVQICSESGNHSRERAESARARFLSKHPKMSARIMFREPSFRVRVGEFRTRSEARGFLRKIQVEFPTAFVVKDEIRYPKNSTEITN